MIETYTFQFTHNSRDRSSLLLSLVGWCEHTLSNAVYLTDVSYQQCWIERRRRIACIARDMSTA